MSFLVFTKNVPVVSELPEEQIASAKGCNISIQENVEEAIKSVDNPNLQNAIEVKGLIFESNLFIENVNTVIFHLQNVVADLEDGAEGKQDLVQIIEKLVQSSYTVLMEINGNPHDLKIKLKECLKLVASVSVDLLKILEGTNQNENSKILSLALGNILRAIDLVKIRNEVINDSPDNITEILKEDVNRISVVISTIALQNGKLELNGVIGAVNKHFRHLEGIVGVFMQQHGGEYSEEIRKLMTVTCTELHDLEVELENLFRGTDDIASLISVIIENVNKRCEIIAKLISAFETGNAVDTTSNDSLPIMTRTMKIRH